MTDATSNRVFAVVLAAGSASRFGCTKQLAEFKNVALVRHATETAFAACADNTALVVGHDWQAVVAACEPIRGFLLVNDQHRAGIGSSISLAVRTLQHAARACIVLLADQPLITAEHVRSLIETWSGADNEIVATAYAGTLGPPVLFPRACYGDLTALAGDSGGRHLFDDDRFTVKQVVFEAAAVDIDTPEDLDNL